MCFLFCFSSFCLGKTPCFFFFLFLSHKDRPMLWPSIMVWGVLFSPTTSSFFHLQQRGRTQDQTYLKCKRFLMCHWDPLPVKHFIQFLYSEIDLTIKKTKQKNGRRWEGILCLLIPPIMCSKKFQIKGLMLCEVQVANTDFACSVEDCLITE